MYEREPEFDAKRAWFERAFLPLLEVIEVGVLPWETVLAWFRRTGTESGTAILAFYARCLEFNLAKHGRAITDLPHRTV